MILIRNSTCASLPFEGPLSFFVELHISLVLDQTSLRINSVVKGCNRGIARFRILLPQSLCEGVGSCSWKSERVIVQLRHLIDSVAVSSRNLKDSIVVYDVVIIHFPAITSVDFRVKENPRTSVFHLILLSCEVITFAHGHCVSFQSQSRAHVQDSHSPELTCFF